MGLRLIKVEVRVRVRVREVGLIAAQGYGRVSVTIDNRGFTIGIGGRLVLVDGLRANTA